MHCRERYCCSLRAYFSPWYKPDEWRKFNHIGNVIFAWLTYSLQTVRLNAKKYCCFTRGHHFKFFWENIMITKIEIFYYILMLFALCDTCLREIFFGKCQTNIKNYENYYEYFSNPRDFLKITWFCKYVQPLVIYLLLHH